ncbi:hypothetical protein B0H66DRAFT_529407 [Apodospora peruviana]|uniref:Uncharacterized protein n=1 Tax=Apodospora peruviana TaxID=516989 RepID=A0AAE0IHM2_9PEZI|nr:hypothetical protein B0H66DRAFT_529407 [Apodospora peruviana]
MDADVVDKDDAQQQGLLGEGTADAAAHLDVPVNAEPASLSRLLHQHLSSSSSTSPSPLPASETLLPSSKPPSSSPNPKTTNSRRRSLSFAFPPLLFQSNTSSTSLAPSTAEGRPIPLDDDTAAHRTSALRKLNSTYPHRGGHHNYAKSSGAQSSTYSQPVLVRTYSGPSPSQTSYSVYSAAHQSSRYRPSSGSRGVSRRVPLPLSSKSGGADGGLSSRPSKPTVSGGVGVGSSGGGSNRSSNNSSTGKQHGVGGGANGRLSMPHHKPKKSGGGRLPLSWQWQTASSRREQDDAKLPPLEAFSFKSFMADMQAQGDETDIGADLDRIAEICARSRYSLSNQYEVHVAPHGSGVSFISGSAGQRRKGHSHSQSGGGGSGGGPTLQAINSDDDVESGTRSSSHRKRRSTGRRRSVAYGTLETIMSSSRSSEEDKSKKKSAAEIAGEVRGRAARNAWDTSTTTGAASGGSGGSASTADGEAGSSSHGGTTTQESGVDTRQSSSGGGTGSAAAARLARKKSASFATAVIDSGRSQYYHHHHGGQGSSSGGGNKASSSVHPRSTTPSALVSEPALPQTSTDHLVGVRTTGNDGGGNHRQATTRSHHRQQALESPPPPRTEGHHLADELPHQGSDQQQQQHQLPRVSTGSSVNSTWSAWIPWRGPGGDNDLYRGSNSSLFGSRGGGIFRADRNSGSRKSHAEGSLRQLLKSVDGGGGGSGSGASSIHKGKAPVTE